MISYYFTVYLFLGDTTDLGRFLDIMQVRGMFATGDYIVIYIDMQPYSEEMSDKYFRTRKYSFLFFISLRLLCMLMVNCPDR